MEAGCRKRRLRRCIRGEENLNNNGGEQSVYYKGLPLSKTELSYEAEATIRSYLLV